MAYFSLNDYDCIAFDMDHTIIQYHLPELQEMIYKCLVEYLKQKDYDASLLTLDNYRKHQDLSVKGVIFDYTKGNFIKIDDKGYVLKCSHGLSQLDDVDIDKEYGVERTWSSFSILKQTMTNASGYGMFENYYVSPAIPLISVLVADADMKNNGRLESYSHIWKDIAEGFGSNFNFTCFKTRRGMFMGELINNPEKYVKKCPQDVIDWLKKLYKIKLTSLITHTFENLAEHLMAFAFGKDWKEHFHFIVGHANKPKFFQEAFKDRYFCTMNADQEISNEEVKELKTHKFYLCGNSSIFEKEVQCHLNLDKTPKIVYFGDSIRSDIYAPSYHCGWDTVTILEEMEGEEELHFIKEKEDSEVLKKKIKRTSKVDKLITVSKQWGSFFCETSDRTDTQKVDTFLGKIVQQHSRLAIPLLDYICNLPMDHKYHFSDDKKFLFYPYPPRSLDTLEVKEVVKKMFSN